MTTQLDAPYGGITYENCQFPGADGAEADRLTQALVDASGLPVREAWRAVGLALDFWESQPSGKRNDSAFFAAFRRFESECRKDPVIRRKLGIR